MAKPTTLARLPSLGAISEALSAVRDTRGTISGWKAARTAAVESTRRNAEAMTEGLDPANRAAIIRQRVSEAAEKAAKAQDGELRETYRLLGLHRDQLPRLREAYGNRLRLLDVMTLGDPARATFSANLANASPAALKAAAEHALATGNLALAAAVVSANDRFPRSSRPFQSREFASVFEGPEDFEAKAGLVEKYAAEVEAAHLDAMDLVAPGVAARERSVGTVGKGLAGLRDAHASRGLGTPGEPLEASTPAPAAGNARERMSRGLAELKSAAGGGEAAGAA